MLAMQDDDHALASHELLARDRSNFAGRRAALWRSDWSLLEKVVHALR
jgi:hypothetical protein